MDKSKQIVGIAKNGRIFPFGSIKKEAIDEVEVSVSNGTGTPSATAELVGKKLILHFENLKGDSFTYEDFTSEQIETLKVKGDTGDSAVYNPEDSEVPDFVMANTMGDSTTKSMTQKAVTDIIVKNTYLEDTTGNVVVVPNGVAGIPVQKAVATLPYSENGYSSIRFVHHGKNIMPFEKPASAVHGNFDTSYSAIDSATNAWVFSVPCKRNTAYYFKQVTTGGGLRICLSDVPAAVGISIYNAVTMTNRDAYTINTGEHDYITFRVTDASEFSRTKTAKVRINCLDSFAYTDFTVCNSYNIDLSGLSDTIYGGTIDFISGKVVSLYDSEGETLTVPVEYQIDANPVFIVDGDNYFWSNVGTINIKYSVKPQAYIDNVISRFEEDIENIQDGLEVDETPVQNSSKLISSGAVFDSLQEKVTTPLSGGQPVYGTSGQILKTLGNGYTEWSDAALPTDEQTAAAVESWLNDHPEATSSVEDGSLTKTKFAPSLIVDAIKDYVVPEMFGAVGDGVTDDTLAFQAALNSGSPVVAPNNYLVDNVTVKDNTLNIIGSVIGQVIIQNRARVYGGKIIGRANTSCVKFVSSDYSTGANPLPRGSMDNSRLENCYLSPNSSTGIGIELYTNTHPMFNFSVGNIVITSCDKSIYFNITNWLTKCDFENIFCKTPNYAVYIDNYNGAFAYCSDITMKNVYAQYYNGVPYNFVKVNRGSCRLIMYDSFCYDYAGSCVYNIYDSIDTRITILGESRHDMYSPTFTNLPTLRNFNYITADATDPMYIKFNGTSAKVLPADYYGGVCFENFMQESVGRFAGFICRGGTISADGSKLFGVGCYEGRLSVLRSTDGTISNSSVVEVATPYSGAVYTSSTLPSSPRNGATCWCSDLKFAVTYYSGTWYKPDGTALSS